MRTRWIKIRKSNLAVAKLGTIEKVGNGNAMRTVQREGPPLH